MFRTQVCSLQSASLLASIDPILIWYGAKSSARSTLPSHLDDDRRLSACWSEGFCSQGTLGQQPEGAGGKAALG